MNETSLIASPDGPPPPLVVWSTDPAHTDRLGRALGRMLVPGDRVVLRGNLGAGKTTFVRGIAAGLGATDTSSPTFGVVHTHTGGRVPFWHADLYRIRDAEELFEAGFYDLIDDAASVGLIEWMEQVPEATPHRRLDIGIQRPSEVEDLPPGFRRDDPHLRRFSLTLHLIHPDRASDLSRSWTSEVS